MKLLYANTRVRPGIHNGANAHVRQFVQHAAALGHEIYMRREGCHPSARPLPTGRWMKFRKVRELDVVYVRLEHAPVSPCTWAIGARRRLIGDPVMVWEFNTVPEFGEYCGLSPGRVQLNIQRLRQLGRGCDLAVCVSERLAEYVTGTLGISRTLVVPNGSEPDLYTPDAPVVERLIERSTGSFNVVWIGSAKLGWHDLDLLSDAARILWDRPNRCAVVFHLIGDGLDRMRDMPPNVHYHGAEDYERLPRWLSAMDVGLCLYRPGPAEFSSPMKVFDYMSSGLAVIATPQPQVREILDEIGTPELLVPPDDPAALANCLESLAHNREYVARVGTAARQLCVKKFTWRRAVGDTFAEIEKVLEMR